jgi:predicted SAM-dependent methyltransferase
VNILKTIYERIVKLCAKCCSAQFRRARVASLPFVPGERSELANLGCGSRYHSAWDNYDLSPCHAKVASLNITRPLPISNEAYQGVYCSHVLEHLPRALAPDFLKDVLRILKPGGILRIVVPDLGHIARLYVENLDAALNGDSSAYLRHEWMTLELLDQMTRSFSGGFMGRLWRSRPLAAREFIEERVGQEATLQLDQIEKAIESGQQPLQPNEVYRCGSPGHSEEQEFRRAGEIHRWMYDRVSLKRLLEDAGFQHVRVCGPTESRIPNFAEYQLDTNLNGSVRKPDSLFMEAVK